MLIFRRYSICRLASLGSGTEESLEEWKWLHQFWDALYERKESTEVVGVAKPVSVERAGVVFPAEKSQYSQGDI